MSERKRERKRKRKRAREREKERVRKRGSIAKKLESDQKSKEYAR